MYFNIRNKTISYKMRITIVNNHSWASEKWNINKRRSYLSPSHSASWCRDLVSTSDPECSRNFWLLILCPFPSFFFSPAASKVYSGSPQCTLGKVDFMLSPGVTYDNLSQQNTKGNMLGGCRKCFLVLKRGFQTGINLLFSFWMSVCEK